MSMETAQGTKSGKFSQAREGCQPLAEMPIGSSQKFRWFTSNVSLQKHCTPIRGNTA